MSLEGQQANEQCMSLQGCATLACARNSPPVVIQAGRVVPLPRPLPAAIGATGSADACAAGLVAPALDVLDPGAAAAAPAASLRQSSGLEMKILQAAVSHICLHGKITGLHHAGCLCAC